MAITATPVKTTGNVRSFDIDALDADTVSGAIAHGVPFQNATEANNRSFVILTPIGTPGQLSQWVQVSLTSTEIVIQKTNAVGSGGAGTLRLTVGMWAWSQA